MNSARTDGNWALWGDDALPNGVTGPTAAASMVATAAIKERNYAGFEEVCTSTKKVVAVALGANEQEARANARLIAAAPTMFEALQKISRLDYGTGNASIAVGIACAALQTLTGDEQ